jgi:hypothetical protein
MKSRYRKNTSRKAAKPQSRKDAKKNKFLALLGVFAALRENFLSLTIQTLLS